MWKPVMCPEGIADHERVDVWVHRVLPSALRMGVGDGRAVRTPASRKTEVVHPLSRMSSREAGNAPRHSKFFPLKEVEYMFMRGSAGSVTPAKLPLGVLGGAEPPEGPGGGNPYGGYPYGRYP